MVLVKEGRLRRGNVVSASLSDVMVDEGYDVMEVRGHRWSIRD
jgi:hypothetical protein